MDVIALGSFLKGNLEFHNFSRFFFCFRRCGDWTSEEQNVGLWMSQKIVRNVKININSNTKCYLVDESCSESSLDFVGLQAPSIQLPSSNDFSELVWQDLLVVGHACEKHFKKVLTFSTDQLNHQNQVEDWLQPSSNKHPGEHVTADNGCP